MSGVCTENYWRIGVYGDPYPPLLEEKGLKEEGAYKIFDEGMGVCCREGGCLKRRWGLNRENTVFIFHILVSLMHGSSISLNKLSTHFTLCTYFFACVCVYLCLIVSVFL